MQKNRSRVAFHLWCGRLARCRACIPSLRSGQALPAVSCGGGTPAPHLCLVRGLSGPFTQVLRPPSTLRKLSPPRGRELLVPQSYDGIDPGRPTRGDIDRQAGDPGEEQGNKGKSQWVGGGSVEEKAG